MLSLKKKIRSFINSDKSFATLTALASGVYPLIHYYNNNFLMVNSWSQLLWFVVVCLIAPIVVFHLAAFCIKQISVLGRFKSHIFTALNIFIFLSLLLLVTYGVTKTYIFVFGVLAVLLMFILNRHLKVLVVIQILLSVVAFVFFVPQLFGYVRYSDDWMQLPDTIDTAVFKETPNVYVIQPDGYTNFPELEMEPYSYDNSEFKAFLKANKFTIYEKNRSNYFSTLTSNASMFAMKHHYYMHTNGANETQYDYRKGLGGDNNAVKIFKKNGYKTFMLLDYPYLVINRPKKRFDVINYEYATMSYIGNTWKGKYPLDTLGYLMKTNKKTNNFFFIEKILPTHIENLSSKSSGIQGERKAYIERLEESNEWLKQTIKKITDQDRDGIIVLVADHGGYVGLESAEDLYSKIEDTTLKKSIFSSLLAIRWPTNKPPQYDDALQSNVNLFRVLFAYLSQNRSYLNYLEENKSYITIKKEAPKGVYEYIDNDGQPSYKKLNNN